MSEEEDEYKEEVEVEIPKKIEKDMEDKDLKWRTFIDKDWNFQYYQLMS